MPPTKHFDFNGAHYFCQPAFVTGIGKNADFRSVWITLKTASHFWQSCFLKGEDKKMGAVTLSP